ncbi:MAG: carboxypeptidase regulatory-like domain-containing protein [Bacteroidota bacterium]
MLLPNTTGTQTLNIANTGGGNLDFSIDISYPVVKSVKIINHKPLAERVTVNIPIKGGQYTVQKNTYKVIPEVVDASAITKSTSLVNKHAPKYGRATVYVNQTGNPSVTYGGIASQTFEAANAAYSCAGADDFEVPGGATWNVGHVFVNGTYSTGSEVPAVDVVFYSDASGFPGSAIATFTGISCISDASGNVNVFLPSVVTLSAGRYWVSVAANMAYGTYGQWYWTRETDPLVLNEFTWQNPGDGFLGCTSWCYGSVMWPAQADYNLAFALTDSVQAPPPSGWLSAAPLTGSVPAGGSVNVQVTFDANGLAVGTYNGLIAISSNDPTHPVKEVPAQLQVKIPGALPLIEDWSSGSYGTNDWTFEPSQSNWTISTYNGNPAPAAEFYWSPSLTGYDYSLVSPSLDASAISDNVTLKFDIYLSNFSSATLEQLAVEVYNGSSWELVQNFDNVNGSIAWTSESFNITSMAAGHAFNVRFRAYGENSFNINNWDLDNIKVYRQVVGNLTGTITKLSDASPIEGAAIAITNAVSGTYATTSGANGVYTLNGVEAGDYAFDVLKEGYNSIEGNLTIVGNETVTHDFQMTAPIVTVDPASLTVTVDVGTTTTREVTVTNSGNGPVNWSGSIHSNKQLSSVPASNGNFPRGSSAVSIGRAPAGTSMPSKPLNGRGDIGYAFDIYPGMTFFSFNTDDPATQNVISTIDYAPFGGSFDAVNTDFMYIIDYNTNTLKKVAIADGTVTDIGSCIPFGAESWTGIAVDKSSNIMYGISTDITESHIYTIDMITGAATVIGPTGIPGAIDCAIDGTGQMYSFDLVNDESYKVDKATGASSLLGSIGYDANYAQGMGWDPTSDIVYIAAYNGATGAGELRILDRVTGNTTLVGGMGGEIDGLAFPGGGGGNWASIDPATGTIAPGGSQIVTVTFDGSYVPPQKDLTVTGNLVFATDPNVGSPEVALSMTITGAFFGVLTGTVTHGGIPVEGVTVTATRQEPPIYTYSMVTGADGVYAFPSTLYGTYDFTAEKAGFNPFISTVPAVVIGDVTTVYNIAMVAPILVINPLEITEEALFGNIITRTVMVTNAGDGWLDWKAVAAAIDKKATVSVPASDGKFARGTAAPSIMRAPAGTSMPSKPLNGKGTLGYAFDIYPGNTFFSFDTDDPSTQNVISSIDYAPFGGTFDATHTDFMYIIDYNTNTLKKVEVATGAVTDIGACNPTGAESWTGITVDKSTNIMYGISTDITESHIYHIDMETGAATVIGPTGIPGAIDCTIDGTGQMYSFDIVNDEAYKVDKETGASQLLGSIGYDANYAQGMGWDPEADIVYLAAYNGATGAGELRILDRVTGNTTLVGTFGGEIDALAFPGGGTPPWLSITPKTGILPAGASEEMTVTLDGTIPPPAKDFTHHGSITFTSLPDVGTVIVPVTFTVTGDFYGKLEGYVKHDGVGIPNATVEAVKAGTPTYSATTDANGHYLIDPILGGTYEVTATATGFIPTSVTGVVITPPNTTMLDLILTAPTMNITPGELVVNLPAGQTTDCTLNISNTGDGMLAWVGSVHINAKQAVSIPASNGVFPRGTAAPSIGRAPVNGTAGTPEFKVVRGSLGYAFDIYPGNTFFSFNTDDPATQNVISSIDYAPFGGTFDAMNLDFMYVIDYNTNTLKKVAIADGTVTDIGSCSPYGAESWTGITVDKTTNIMYGISTDITESHIYTIDMVTGAATVIGPTGIPGAIDVTVDGTGQMYSFDIVNDEAYAINKETGASTLLGSIGYDANYAQGMGWDPAADIVYLAAYNGATGAGELRILDRVTGNTTLVGGMGGEIDGLGFPGGGSAWLSMDPRQGVVPAGNSMNTNVHFDATDLAEGTYTGFITFLSEPNVGTVNVPVTLVVGQIGGPTLTISQVFDVPAGPVSVPVHATEITNMGSFQFTLDFDASKLTYTGTSNWYTGITDVLVGTPAAGKLTFVWAASTAGITITDGIFFNVDFTYNGSLDFANIGWSDNPTPREFADYNGTIFLPYYNSGFVTGRGVGVPENGPQSIKVYPNPASDVVNVKSDFTIKSIEVLSFIGQTVYTQNNLDTKQIQLNVSSFGSGVYFVKLNTSEGVKTTKITVKH